MLSLLLDEHLSPVIAEQLKRKHPGIRIIAIRDWRGGAFLETPDPIILAAAFEESMTLVTYDQRTIAPLLKSWMEQGIDHGGVVFIDEKTIASQDFGGLVKSLGLLWKREGRADWKNRVVFLRRPI